MLSPNDRQVIQIDITNACIHTCSNCTRFCGYHKKPFFMDFEYFCKAVDTMIDRPGVIGIIGGEPTLHPQFREMCDYLKKRILERDGGETINDSFLQYPTRYYIDEVNKARLANYELMEFNIKKPEYQMSINGAGLWSTLTRGYRRNMEYILDTFGEQYINDHESTSYHQPILIGRKELGISDEEWLKLREECWVNKHWSGAVTPKGVFFCEVAGSLDLLYDGEGGLPVEEGWWKKPIEYYKDQFKWCELCGLPLHTKSRNANDCITDISIQQYNSIKNFPNVDLSRNKINVIDFNDNEWNKDNDEYHGNEYLGRAEDRISRSTEIIAGDIIGILLCDETITEETSETIAKRYSNIFTTIHVIKHHDYIGMLKNGIFSTKLITGITWDAIFNLIGEDVYFAIFTDDISINRKFNELKECVINPGILYYIELAQSFNNGLISYKEKSIFFLTSSYASSWELIDTHSIIDIENLQKIINCWSHRKKIPLSRAMSLSIKKKSLTRRHIENLRYFIKIYKAKHGIRGLIKLLYYKASKNGLKRFIAGIKHTWRNRL